MGGTYIMSAKSIAFQNLAAEVDALILSYIGDPEAEAAAAAEMNELVNNSFDRAAWEAELAEEMAFAETWDGIENPPLDGDCDGLEA